MLQYMAAKQVDKEKALKQLGEQIVRLRKAKKITAAEFARRCDMESSNMARIEMGRANLTFYNLLRIAKALEVPITELVKNFDD